MSGGGRQARRRFFVWAGSARTFTLTAPPRLVVDFENAAYGLERDTILVGGRVLERIRASRFRVAPTPVVRIVFDLKRPVPYWSNRRPAGW